MPSTMRLWELESALGELESFDFPVAGLEQYATSAHLAARLLHTADFQFQDIKNHVVLDLGCGCGTLAIASSLLGAAHVVGFEIDEAALNIARKNSVALDLNENIDFARIDVLQLLPRTSPRAPTGVFDTVVMNPPFGTKRKGIDVAFLQVAVAHARKAVYTLHKTSTREYIKKQSRRWGARPEVLAQMRFDIPNMYKFHTQKSVDIDVDFWRIDVSHCDRALNSPLTSSYPEDNVSLDVSLPRALNRRSHARSRRCGKRS